jgi:hypothetical protein
VRRSRWLLAGNFGAARWVLIRVVRRFCVREVRRCSGCGCHVFEAGAFYLARVWGCSLLTANTRPLTVTRYVCLCARARLAHPAFPDSPLHDLFVGLGEVLEGALEKSTRSARATAYAQWTVFCELFGLDELRRGNNHHEGIIAAGFVHWLVSRTKKKYKSGARAWGPLDPDSALGYLSSVSQHLVQTLRVIWAPPRQLSNRVVTAWHKKRTKEHGVGRFMRKLPVTIGILRWVLQDSGYGEELRRFWAGLECGEARTVVDGAAAVHAWSTLSRLGDFLQTSWKEVYDVHRRPTVADIVFQVRGVRVPLPSVSLLRAAYPDVTVFFRVKTSKADQAGKRWGNHEIELRSRAGDAACPVLAHMVLTWAVPCSSTLRGSAPLFRCVVRGVMRSYRRNDLRASIVRRIQNTYGNEHTGHSFRVGGACALSAMGVSVAQIKILGRWTSDAIEMYLRVHAGQCAEALAGMAGASESDNWYKFGGFAHELLREPLE